ncbi:MAG: acyltransferase [Betaproteobacteria bacterium]|nr:acyltransferase [Betaproteobacteria bacterium]
MVVWLHAKELTPGMNEYFRSGFGAAGVDLFFVISGLIMMVSTANKEITPWEFFVRRIQRIAPLYWLAMTLLVLVALVAPQLQRSTTLGWSHVVASYFFIPMDSPSFPGHMWPVLVPGWTLNYEMAFYAIFAISLFFGHAWRIPFVALVIAASVAIGQWLNLQGVLGFYTNEVMLTFVLGALVGRLVVSPRFTPSAYKGTLFLLMAVVSWFALEALAIPSRFLNAGVPAALVVVGCSYLPVFRSRATRYLALLGDASYSIYLTHIFTLAALRIVVKIVEIPSISVTHCWLLMGCSLLACSIVGYLSYRFIEQPISRKFKR